MNDAPVEFASRVLVGLTSREARHAAVAARRPAGKSTAARRI